MEHSNRMTSGIIQYFHLEMYLKCQNYKSVITLLRYKHFGGLLLQNWDVTHNNQYSMLYFLTALPAIGVYGAFNIHLVKISIKLQIFGKHEVTITFSILIASCFVIRK